MGFEPTTLTLARLCSTPELHPRSVVAALGSAPTRAYMPNRPTDCNPDFCFWQNFIGACGNQGLQGKVARAQKGPNEATTRKVESE